MEIDDLDAEFGASPLGKSSAKRAEVPPQEQEASVEPTKVLDFNSMIPPSAAPLAAGTGAAQHDAAAPLDLYGDLYGEDGAGNVLLKTQLAQLKDQCSKQEVLIQELQQQVGLLKSQNSELQETKTTLTQNISSLYNTAKLEIERKDNEIKELREKLYRGTAGGGGGRGSGRQQEQPRAGSRGRDREYSEDRGRQSRLQEGSRDRHGGGGGASHQRRPSSEHRDRDDQHGGRESRERRESSRDYERRR